MMGRGKDKGKRRRRGEYATFDLHIEGLSAKAQELRAGNTFIDDFDGSEQAMKSEIAQSRERAAKSYEEYAARLSGYKQKFINETIEANRRRAENADALIKRRLSPTLHSNAKPGQGAIPLGDKLEVIVHHKGKPWRRL